MKNINNLKQYFTKYAEYFGLSNENAFSILFPMLLGMLVLLLLILAALILGIENTSDVSRIITGLGIASMFLSFSISGFMMMIKLEIPGKPTLRGSILARIWGFITALFFLVGGLFLSIRILTQ